MLGEIVSFKTGKLNSNAAKPNGRYPFFTCSQETFKTDTYSFDTECVLLGGNNANRIYPIKYFSGKFDAYQRTYVIRSLDDRILLNRYLYYALKLKLQLLRDISTGAATKFLTLTILNGIELNLPPLPTQRRIAAILSAYDDLIENNTRRIKILEEMAQALYREWFVHFRFPGHEKVRIVDSPLGKIPEGWEVNKLETVCKKITDGSHWSPQSVLDGIPMASVKDMNDWGLDIENCRRIREDDYSELVRNDCRPLKGDVLIAKDGSYLKHIFVVDKEYDLAILSSIAILRPKEGMNPYLLAMYLKEPSVTARMKGYVSGVAIPRIVLKDFRKFEIVIPPEVLQKAWWGIEEPFINQCLRLMDKNATLRSARDLLIPKLITGDMDLTKLRISGVEDIA